MKKVVNRCESINEESERGEGGSGDEEDRDEEERPKKVTKKHNTHVRTRKSGKMTKADDFNDKTLGVH